MLKKSFYKFIKSGTKYIMLNVLRDNITSSEIFSDKNILSFCKRFEDYWLSSFPNVEHKSILFHKEIFIYIKTKNSVNLYVSSNEFKKMIYDYIVKNKKNRETSFFCFNFYNVYIYKTLSLTLDYYDNYYNDPKFLKKYNMCLYSFSSGFKNFIEEESTISKYSLIPLSHM